MGHFMAMWKVVGIGSEAVIGGDYGFYGALTALTFRRSFRPRIPQIVRVLDRTLGQLTFSVCSCAI